MMKGKKYPHLQKARIGYCVVCGKQYRAVKDFKKRKQKYCSKECAGKEWRKKIVLPEIGARVERSASWKGEEAKYSAKHKWLVKRFGNEKKCFICGKTDKKKYEWACKDHKYSRNPDDYFRLCVSCHRKYDIAKGFLKTVFNKRVKFTTVEV